MRMWPAAALLLWPMQGAGQEPAPFDLAEVDRCYIRQALQFDDKTSDVLSVARIVRFLCDQEEKSVVKSAQTFDALKEPMLLRAGSIVLRIRARAKGDLKP